MLHIAIQDSGRRESFPQYPRLTKEQTYYFLKWAAAVADDDDDTRNMAQEQEEHFRFGCHFRAGEGSHLHIIGI